MDVLSSSWGVELVGFEEDVTNITDKVNGSIRSQDDFFISKLDECVVLRTARWNAARDFDEARQVAGEDLSLLNACIEIQDGGLSLTIGTVFLFRSDGGVDQDRITEFKVRVQKQNQASPASFKNVVNAARSSDGLRLALSELTPDHGWFQIFKALEALARHYGGEGVLLQAVGEKASEIKRMKRTANSYRHAAGSYAPISNPMELHDARLLIKSVVMDALGPAVSQLPKNTILAGIPNLKNAAGHPKFGLKALKLNSPDGTAHVGETIHAPH